MAIKLPPYDLEIEKIVLGSLIANSNSLNEVRTIINEDCFYDLFHKDVFKAIKSLKKWFISLASFDSAKNLVFAINPLNIDLLFS